jgi:hypothetical protein
MVSQPVEEGGPLVRWRVVKKAILKEAFDKESAKLGVLEPGRVLVALERRDNRVRSAEGWASILAEGGKAILVLDTPLGLGSPAKAHLEAWGQLRQAWRPPVGRGRGTGRGSEAQQLPGAVPSDVPAGRGGPRTDAALEDEVRSPAVAVAPAERDRGRVRGAP